MSSSKSKPVTNQESKWVESNSDLASFSTVNGFWSIYEKVLRPSMCPKESEGKKNLVILSFAKVLNQCMNHPQMKVEVIGKFMHVILIISINYGKIFYLL